MARAWKAALCVTEELDKDARRQAAACAAADLQLMRQEATDEALKVFDQSPALERLGGTQRVDRGVWRFAPGRQGFWESKMAGRCTCGWRISPTHLNWESPQSTPSG
jgi:hypothetical protein